MLPHIDMRIMTIYFLCKILLSVLHLVSLRFSVCVRIAGTESNKLVQFLIESMCNQQQKILIENMCIEPATTAVGFSWQSLSLIKWKPVLRPLQFTLYTKKNQKKGFPDPPPPLNLGNFPKFYHFLCLP